MEKLQFKPAVSVECINPGLMQRLSSVTISLIPRLKYAILMWENARTAPCERQRIGVVNNSEDSLATWDFKKKKLVCSAEHFKLWGLSSCFQACDICSQVIPITSQSRAQFESAYATFGGAY